MKRMIFVAFAVGLVSAIWLKLVDTPSKPSQDGINGGESTPMLPSLPVSPDALPLGRREPASTGIAQTSEFKQASSGWERSVGYDRTRVLDMTALLVKDPGAVHSYADQGDIIALAVLGDHYVTQEPSAAFELYQRAIFHGSVAAMGSQVALFEIASNQPDSSIGRALTAGLPHISDERDAAIEAVAYAQLQYQWTNGRYGASSVSRIMEFGRLDQEDTEQICRRYKAIGQNIENRRLELSIQVQAAPGAPSRQEMSQEDVPFACP
ncbi:MAG: hypothetical protein AAAFM81_07705 [Pseudomonadota bacterium]